MLFHHLAFLLFPVLAHAVPFSNTTRRASTCFPALDFKMPSSVPNSLDGWWCESSTEYAFVGFSYEITACQNQEQLNKEFADIRHKFHGRYVRIYGACDKPNYYDTLIEAAWSNSLGIHALIWFGFTGSTEWKSRKESLINTLYTNPKAKFVTRAIQFGSEALFDSVLSPADLAKEVLDMKERLKDLRIPVTVSDMAYGFQKFGAEAGVVLKAMDFVDAHMLPFFSQQASTADQSWPIVIKDIQWFVDHAKGKKIWLSENGWPSKSYPGVQPNSKAAVSDIKNEEAYYKLLDSHCKDLKSVAGGGVSWFAHLYSDNQEPGYGIYGTDGKMKFAFQPRVAC